MEDIAKEIFGDMRHLTPEENEKKKEMYRKMSSEAENDKKKVKHGIWIKHYYFSRYDEGGTSYECSLCGCEGAFYNKYNYCPNCGASMKDILRNKGECL